MDNISSCNPATHLTSVLRWMERRLFPQRDKQSLPLPVCITCCLLLASSSFFLKLQLTPLELLCLVSDKWHVQPLWSFWCCYCCCCCFNISGAVSWSGAPALQLLLLIPELHFYIVLNSSVVNFLTAEILKSIADIEEGLMFDFWSIVFKIKRGLYSDFPS